MGFQNNFDKYFGRLSDLIIVDQIHSNRTFLEPEKNNSGDMETMGFHNILITILINIIKYSHS